MTERRTRPEQPRLNGRRYVNLTFIAVRLAVSVKTVRKWIAAGTLPASRFGNEWRVAEDDLAKFEFRARFSPTDSPSAPCSAL